jgi:HAD superfamily hydrolase (TIGR01549 family)
MNRITTCIFDYGDTLVGYPLRTQESQLAFLVQFFRENGTRFAANPNRPLVAEGQLHDFARRLNTELASGEVWPFQQRIRSNAFLGEHLQTNAEAELEQKLCNAVFAQAVQFSDSISSLREIGGLGYRIGIVSNSPWGTAPALWRGELDRRGFGSDLVDATVFCCEAGFRKPRNEPFRRCLQLLGAAPTEAVFIGDNPVADVQGATNAGCHAVLCFRSQSPTPIGFEG